MLFHSPIAKLSFMIMASITPYNNCLKSLYSLKRFGIILGLSVIRDILENLGNPQRNYSCIHVAGTNGKGSVASGLAAVLYAAGYKTGLYTSPHLVRFNERIVINNKPVINRAVVESYESVKNAHKGNREPTYFEYATAMGLYEFGRQKVDWAVIETGMGGRLDATNIINPALSIITNISIEHREYLGNTISEITAEKAGIIKTGKPVITGVKQEKAAEVINRIAFEKSAPVFRLGKDFKIRKKSSGAFTYYGIEHTWKDLSTGLLGNYQADNAAIVLAACELLNQKKATLPIKDIRKGLKENIWPGRLEIVSTSPLIILDGAHNLVAARNLAKYLSGNLSDKNIILVTGILDDKPYKAMLKTLLPICKKVILTQAGIDRALPTETLAAEAKKITPHVKMIPSVAEAVNFAIQSASSKDAICIAGSLYVIGEAKQALKKG